MNKAQLIEQFKKNYKPDMSNSEAERCVAALIDSIILGVKKTDSVQIVGFGTFKKVTRKARTGRNPKTGEKMKIKASKTVKFVVGKFFKNVI